jgi:predicted  nucleic acid-binding Zn-ribbon protein
MDVSHAHMCDEVARLNAEVDCMSTAMSQCLGDLSAANKHIHSLAQRHEESQVQSEARHATLAQDLAQAQSQLDTLQQAIDDKDGQISELKNASSGLADTCSALERERDDARREVEVLAGRMQARNELVAKLHTLTAPLDDN